MLRETLHVTPTPLSSRPHSQQPHGNRRSTAGPGRGGRHLSTQKAEWAIRRPHERHAMALIGEAGAMVAHDGRGAVSEVLAGS